MTDQTLSQRPHLTDKESSGVIDWSSGPRRFITLYLPLSIFVIVLLFPFYWMAITAIKPNSELLDYKNNNPFWVKSPTLENIHKLLFQTDYPHPTSLYPDVQDRLVKVMKEFDPATRKLILQDNAVKLFNLDL